jgi:hypothetical protein
MTECNSTFGEIVRGEFHSDFITGKHANAVAAKSAGQMRQHYSLVLQLYTEQAAGKLLQHRPGYFYAVLFTHKPPLL